MRLRKILFPLGCAVFLGVIATGTGCEETAYEPSNSDQPPEINWAHNSFDDAARLAELEGRFLLVYAWADWCGPCRLMAQTTWSDSNVISWVSRNTVPFKWDVDNPDLRGLIPDVKLIPTVVVLTAGDEVDRRIGYASAAAFLDWLSLLPGQ